MDFVNADELPLAFGNSRRIVAYRGVAAGEGKTIQSVCDTHMCFARYMITGSSVHKYQNVCCRRVAACKAVRFKAAVKTLLVMQYSLFFAHLFQTEYADVTRCAQRGNASCQVGFQHGFTNYDAKQKIKKIDSDGISCMLHYKHNIPLL